MSVLDVKTQNNDNNCILYDELHWLRNLRSYIIASIDDVVICIPLELVM